MPFEFFLAQTAVEFGQTLPKDAKKAWMACHFSPYGTGLSNLPSQLSEDSMVIVNDLIPVAGHDPERIAAQLHQLVATWGCHRVLLDFQRPGIHRTAQIAQAIVDALDCPVGVSEHYARELDCPVFLPPLPLPMALADHIMPWQGRPIWLEVMPDHALLTITEDGCKKSAHPSTSSLPHFDEQTCCRYGIRISEDAIHFSLSRGLDELQQLQKHKEIECVIGLYQAFAQPEAQATALDQ